MRLFNIDNSTTNGLLETAQDLVGMGLELSAAAGNDGHTNTTTPSYAGPIAACAVSGVIFCLMVCLAIAFTCFCCEARKSRTEIANDRQTLNHMDYEP